MNWKNAIKRVKSLIRNSGIKAYTVRDTNTVHFLTSEQFDKLPEYVGDHHIEAPSFLYVNFGDLCVVKNKG